VDSKSRLVCIIPAQTGIGTNPARRRLQLAPNLIEIHGPFVSCTIGFIRIGSGSGNGKVLLIGFDHEHTTKIGRGENGGRTLAESNVVRSIRPVGEWSGKPVDIREHYPDGQDVAVVIESSDGKVVGAGRLSSGST
jgi:hypothetical protein